MKWFRYIGWCYDTANDGGSGGADSGGAAGGTGGGAGDPWYKGKADDRIVGTWQNNFPQHLNDPAALALAATNSFLEAQKLLGAPASELVRLPNKADDPAWQVVWRRLGAPDAAAGYELKAADGKDYDAPFADAIREVAFALHLPKEGAAQLAASMAKFAAAQSTAAEAAYGDKLKEQRAELSRSWGQHFEANKELAKMGAKALGVDADVVNSLEQTVGYAKVMEMLRGVGARTSEGKFILANNGSGNNNGGPMTREQAVAKKQELYQDAAFVKRFNEGEAQAVREMNALDVILASTSQYAA